eukprot:gene11320-12506_t
MDPQEGFANLENLKALLKDSIFVDYFNTFLSLPIFAIKVFYCKDQKRFEVDPEPEYGFEYVQDNVLHWVYAQRRSLFLKTDIYNEYRLCRFMTTYFLEQNNQADEEPLDFGKELGNVLAMQRFKAFLNESAGVRVVSFWLAAERYRQQTTFECRRFALREIQDKFVQQGSRFELPQCMKFQLNLDLKACTKGPVMPCDMKSNLLLGSQKLAFDSLVGYWVPKFFAHRRRIRQAIRIKWQNAMRKTANSFPSDGSRKNSTPWMVKMYKEIVDKERGEQPSSSEGSVDDFDDFEELEERLNKEVLEVFKQAESIDSFSESYSDIIITLDDGDDDDDDCCSDKVASSRNLSLQLKLPPICSKMNVSTGNRNSSKQHLDIPRLCSKSSNLSDSKTSMPPLCFRSRDTSYSRIAALRKSNGKASSIDFESSVAFPSTFIEHNKPYLNPDSPRKTSLTPDTASKLRELLLKDLSFTVLNAACHQCCKALYPIWLQFLKIDEDIFLSEVAIQISTSIIPESKTTQKKRKGLERKTNENNVNCNLDDYICITEKRRPNKNDNKRSWTALQLAMAICVRENAKPLLEGYEEFDEQVLADDYQSSLQCRQLRVLNKEAAKALEDHHRTNPIHCKLAQYFYQQNLLFGGGMGNNSNPLDNINMITTEAPKRRSGESKPRLRKPSVFQEILHDPVQFDAFKKFLVKHEAESPLIFWQAVESMRTNTREAKQRQSRANGIFRRFFGPSANNGKALACNADIVKELSQMTKVTPAMLVSAQTCVARSMEDKWMTLYLSTFPDEDELPGITKLPQFRASQVPGNRVNRCMKQKSLMLWKTFARNILSFRRGISNDKTLRHFQNYLNSENAINIKRGEQAGEEQTQRVLIGNKLVYTDKLIRDLKFWSEVERYKDFAEALILCAKLGIYAKDDELIVTKKAKAIVNCFIDSQVPPKIQINISSDAADNIVGLVKNDIIEGSLFHEAAISVFAILLHYWKKFCYYRLLPASKLPKCPESAKSDRSHQIEIRKKAIHKNQMRRVSLQPEDEFTKIMFSLQNGYRITVVPLNEETNIGESHETLPPLNPLKLNKLFKRLKTK